MNTPTRGTIRMHGRGLVLGALLGALLAACGSNREPAGAAGDAPPASFELDCSAANTSTAAELHCVRTDTRSGEIMVVDFMRLPVLDGPSTAAAAPAGRYTTTCDAASTDTRSDFYCIRMNTETGELMLVNLQKAGVVPPRPAP